MQGWDRFDFAVKNPKQIVFFSLVNSENTPINYSILNFMANKAP